MLTPLRLLLKPPLSPPSPASVAHHEREPRIPDARGDVEAEVRVVHRARLAQLEAALAEVVAEGALLQHLKV